MSNLSMHRERSTPLPRLASSAARSLLPRLGTAPPTMPGTPPALSHYATLTPVRVPKPRDGTVRFSANVRMPTELGLEQIRLEVEARERQEADFWGYGRKVRPGSRMGQDNRKMPALPPWAQSAEVAFALGEMERQTVPIDRLRRTGLLTKLGDSQGATDGFQINNYGRVVPYALVKTAELLEGITADMITVPDGKSEKGCISICEFTQAEGLLNDVVRTRHCDVLMGNQIPGYPEKLGPLLPALRMCLLGGNGIGDNTSAIADGLKKATKLTHLTLTDNHIADQGIILIAQSISNTTLVSLNLQRNRIANEGAVALGYCYTKCPCSMVMNKAIAEGQAAVVEAVLLHGFPVNPIYPSDEALLLKAAHAGSASICECLLDKDADIEAKSSCGHTAVMLAATNGHRRVLTLLLDRGAEMNLKDCEGQSALMLAARYGHTECLQVLIGVAKLLPQKVGVYVRGVRDLQVHAPSNFERVPSVASSNTSKSSVKSAWGKVRGAALAIGTFARIGSRGSQAGGGTLSRTASSASNANPLRDSHDPSTHGVGVDSASRGNANTGSATKDGVEISAPSSAVTSSTTPKLALQGSSRWGPGLLSRMSAVSSFSRRLSASGSVLNGISDADAQAQSEAKAQAAELRARAAEKTFGRLPSTVSAVSGTDFGSTSAAGNKLDALKDEIDESYFVAAEYFGQSSAAGDAFQRLPSVSEDRSHDLDADSAAVPPSQPGLTDSPRAGFRRSDAGSHPGSRGFNSGASRKLGGQTLGRRPSLFSTEPTQDAAADEITAADLELPGTNAHETSEISKAAPSKTAAALAKAPKLSTRPSMAMWGAGSSNLLTGNNADQSNVPAVQTAEATNQSQQEVGLINMQGVDRAGAKRSTSVGSFMKRTGSFGKMMGHSGSLALTRQDMTRSASDHGNDTIQIRLTLGKLTHKQEFTTPFQEVPSKSGATKFIFTHQFTNVSAGSNNTRLKLELLYLEPDQPSGTPKCVGLCVEDLDNLLVGTIDEIDGWFVVHDFNTRRRVGAVQCTIRCMPEQFYDICFSGDNVLIHAARNGQTDCVRMLIDAGISMNFASKDGNTPLIAAAKAGHRSTVEMLLRHGANIHVKNKGGLNALDVAEKFDQMLICRILRGVIHQQQELPFTLDTWPSDIVDETDPMAFLKDRYRGNYADSLLVVEVVGARHLPKSDVMGLSDPFFNLELNGVKHATRVLKKTLAPMWNETFQFDDQSLGVWAGQKIKCEVYDWDYVGDSDLLGSFHVDVASIVQLQPLDSDEMGEAWYPLRNEDGKIVRGQHDPQKLVLGQLEDSEVCLRFRFTPAQGRYMEIGIMEARFVPNILPAAKGGALPNSFATVAIAGGSYRTHPVKKEANPKWNTTYRFNAKSMDSLLCLEIHELQLAKKKGAAGTKLEPGEKSLIGRVKVPLHRLFSLSNSNLKDIWVELTDRDGMRLRDVEGMTTALRIAINFVVLGETASTWSLTNVNSLHVERNTKLNADVVKALTRILQAPASLLAIVEYEKLSTQYEDKIPLKGMCQAAKVLDVDMSVDVLMLRLLTNTANMEYAKNFEEFSKVLNIIEDQMQDESGEWSPYKTGSPVRYEEEEDAHEKLVQKDVKGELGMRVMLSEETKRRFPKLVEQSGGGGVSSLCDLLADDFIW